MAARFSVFLTVLLIFASVSISFGQDQEQVHLSCEEKCCNTFSLHTYPKPENRNACLRGCRFFTLIDMVEEYDVNATRDSCALSCTDAYGDDAEMSDACALGCRQQQPFFSPLEQYMMNEMDAMLRPPLDTGFFLPFLYVRDTYSNMVDKQRSEQARVSWSFYMASADGKMVVIQSEPSYSDNGEMTSNYIETNIGAMDDSATPNVRHYPYYANRYSRDRDLSLAEQEASSSSDWLSCISRRTGLPRVALTFAIFVSALGMIWLAITTTVTASEHRVVKPKGISIYGDLEYVTDLENKGLLTKVTPIGPEVQAPPLPIKLKVQQI